MGLTMRRLLKPLWVLLALVFLVEAWLWEHLRPLVARVVDLIAWDRLKARFAAWIEHLPPYPTLLIFLIPPIILFPFKLLGLWMLAHGSWLGATVVIILAKLVGTAVAAFIFDATRPKLLQLPWFRWLYEHMLVWLEKAHAIIDPIKARLREQVVRLYAPIKRRVRRWLWLAKPGRPGRFFRRLARIRRRVQTPQPAE
jgi:hypothetical protein